MDICNYINLEADRRQMRILQVGTGFASIPPTGAYATERTIHFLSSALVALGHQVTVLDIENENRPPVPYQTEEVRLRWHRDSNSLTHILRGFAFRQASIGKVRELIKSGNFDIVNFHNQFSAWHIPWVRKCDIPTAYTLHNSLWYDSSACRSAWQRLKFFQDIRAMRRSNVIICENRTTSLNLIHQFGIADCKITVIPPGISGEWLNKVNIPKNLRALYAPNGGQVILNVARIAPYKNQLTLARAIPLVVEEVPDARFIFVGPITDKDYYRQICHFLVRAELMPHVSFTGEIPYLDLPKFYSLSDVTVFPSSSEAFGVVIMEAMAQGKAIVASNIETFQELLREARGITIPVFDHKALANAIVTLLKNKSLREEMGQKAKEHVMVNYTWENMAKKTIEIYKIITKVNL